MFASMFGILLSIFSGMYRSLVFFSTFSVSLHCIYYLFCLNSCRTDINIFNLFQCIII